MKTKSLKSIATLFGVAAVLNLSALAGPGPQSQVQPRKVSQAKEVTVALYHGKKQEPVVKSRPTLTQVSGPHGVNFGFR